MLLPHAVEKLSAELGKLPGVGQRTAFRLAFHVLKTHRDYAQDFAKALQDLHDGCRGHGSIQEGCTILDALGSEKITQQFRR